VQHEPRHHHIKPLSLARGKPYLHASACTRTSATCTVRRSSLRTSSMSIVAAPGRFSSGELGSWGQQNSTNLKMADLAAANCAPGAMFVSRASALHQIKRRHTMNAAHLSEKYKSTVLLT